MGFQDDYKKQPLPYPLFMGMRSESQETILNELKINIVYCTMYN